MCGSYSLVIQTAGGTTEGTAEATLYGVADASETKRKLMERVHGMQPVTQPQMTTVPSAANQVGNLQETNTILCDIRDTLRRIEGGRGVF